MIPSTSLVSFTSIIHRALYAAPSFTTYPPYPSTLLLYFPRTPRPFYLITLENATRPVFLAPFTSLGFLIFNPSPVSPVLITSRSPHVPDDCQPLRQTKAYIPDTSECPRAALERALCSIPTSTVSENSLVAVPHTSPGLLLTSYGRKSPLRPVVLPGPSSFPLYCSLCLYGSPHRP